MSNLPTTAEIAELIEFLRHELAERHPSAPVESELTDGQARYIASARSALAIAERLPALVAERDRLSTECAMRGKEVMKVYAERDRFSYKLHASMDGSAKHGYVEECRLLSADIARLTKERDDATIAGWRAAHDAALYVGVNGLQDLKSKEGREGYMLAANDIARELRSASPGGYLDIEWKNAQDVIAAQKERDDARAIIDGQNKWAAEQIAGLVKERDGARACHAKWMGLQSGTADVVRQVEKERDQSDNALRRIGMSLGSSDEWIDQATMISDVEGRVARLSRENAAMREALEGAGRQIADGNTGLATGTIYAALAQLDAPPAEEAIDAHAPAHEEIFEKGLAMFGSKEATNADDE